MSLYFLKPQISTVDETNSAIAKDASKIATYDTSSISFAQSASSSGSSTADGIDSRTTKDSRIGSHDSISSTQSSSSSYKTSQSTQHLIAPLPKVHTAKLPYHEESSRFAISHGYISSPLVKSSPILPVRPSHTRSRRCNSSNSPASSSIYLVLRGKWYHQLWWPRILEMHLDRKRFPRKAALGRELRV